MNQERKERRTDDAKPFLLDVFDGEYSLDDCACVVFIHWVKDPKNPTGGIIAYATDECELTHQDLLVFAQDLGFMEDESGVIGGGQLDCINDFNLIRGSYAFGRPQNFAVEALQDHLRNLKQ